MKTIFYSCFVISIYLLLLSVNVIRGYAQIDDLRNQILQQGIWSHAIVTQGTNSITVKVNFSNLNYQIDSTANGYIVNMQEMSSNGIPGAPNLPTKNFVVELPGNVIFSSISTTINSLNYDSIGVYSIAPCPYPNDTSNEFIQDETIYSQNADYPVNPVISGYPGKLRHWVFLGISLNSFQYNPVTRNLKRIDSLTFTISYQTSRDTYQYPCDPSLSIPGYVVITTDSIKLHSQKLTEFLNSKKEIGYKTYLVTIDSLLLANFDTLPPPAGRAERIRRFLQLNYDKCEMNIEDVLLIGNPDPKDIFDSNDTEGDVPMKMVKSLNMACQNYYYYYFDDLSFPRPTDCYYSDMNGNWDLDGDEIFGEYADDLNQLPPNNIDTTNFSIRWSGKIIIPANQSIMFQAFYKDGFRIYIDSILYNSSDPNDPHYWSDTCGWCDHKFGSMGESSSNANNLLTGTHDIIVEYYQTTKDALMRVFYKSGEYGLLYKIPDTLFKHIESGILQPGLVVEYFNNKFLSGTPDTERIDNNLYFSRIRGDNGPNGVDLDLELNVGRIPVYDNNINDLDSILDRSIKYQFNYLSDISWRKKELIPIEYTDASTEYSWEIGDTVKHYCDANNFSIYRIYWDSIPYVVDRTNLINTCTIDTVKSIWNTNKFGLVSWYTHGDITDAEAIMDTNHVHLLNKEYPSFVFQGSCSNGYPEDKCNLGYYLLLNQAVGTISASRQSYFDPMRNSGYLIQQYSTNYERDVYNEWIILFSKFIMENMSIGNVLKNLRSTSSFKISQELLNIFSFNLYGDPSLRIKSTIQPISIKQGWNMISSYLIPDRDSMCSVLWGIHNNLKFVKDITDSCCKPDSINHIYAWNCNKAYHFYMYAPDTLYFAGTKINPTLDTIHLKSGWNWVSYLRDTPKSIDTCLNNIKNILTIAKTEDGKMYVPQYSINQIGNMVPGQGYYLSVTGNVNLVYPADSNSYFLYRETVEDKLTPLAQKIKPAITNTGNNCTLIVDSTNIPDGFEIGIIDNDGDIIGSGSVFNGKCAITIWGIDKVNQNMGSEQNEILKIFALDTALNHIYDLKLNSLRDIINGNLYNDLNYQENNIYLTSAIIDLITNDSAKISCRPNPLNESTEIEYTIPFDTMVLLSISSINGEVINSFELGYQSMGKNHYIIDCSKLPEGIYNIFLSFNKTTISTRILIIR